MDLGKGSIALACAAGLAIHGALDAGGYTPGLLVASLLVMINLALGVYVSATEGRHPIIAFVNFCTCFVPLIIAKAHGGEFQPELVNEIYHALF